MTYAAVVSAAVSTVSRAALCALLGLCLMAGLLPQAGASSAPPTFTVTRTADDTAPGSLRGAIAQAAAVGGTVNFQIPATDPGVRNGNATITLSLGPLVVPSSLSIVGPNMPSGAITVSGGTGANQSRIFSVTGGTVAFSNLVISRGFASPGNVNFSESGGGGGILNSANLTLTNCAIAGNQSSGSGANGNGGGLANSGTATLSGCSFQGDFSGEGGAIFNSGTLALSSCSFTQNIASGGAGLLNGGLATVNDCTFTNNSTEGAAPLTGGGGVYNTGILTLNGCAVGGNSSGLDGSGTDGGGIYNDANGSLTLSACTLSNNEAGAGFIPGTGGGINNLGTAQITNCLIVENSGYYVAGLNNTGTLTLINSTFAGNEAGGTGVFQGSRQTAGGLLSGPATLTNDIFYFDDFQFSTLSEIVALAGTAGPTVTYSDVQQVTGVYPGVGNINTDPLFARDPFNPLTNYTRVGDTGDEHLLPLSPAIHTGTNGPGVPVTDIVGTPRPTPPARPSMGAYEVPGFSAQGGFTVTGTQNVSTGPQVVAKFLPGTMTASSYTATVDFGDGTGPMPGTISTDPTAPSVLQVTGSHTYTSPGTFTITVVISGPGGTPTATVTSAANIQPILASLSFPSPVPGGTVVTATVTLTGVTSSDMVVGLSSSDPTVVRISGRGVIVHAGSQSATFTINTFRNHVTKTVTIQATLGQVTLTRDLTITGS